MDIAIGIICLLAAFIAGHFIGWSKRWYVEEDKAAMAASEKAIRESCVAFCKTPPKLKAVK